MSATSASARKGQQSSPSPGPTFSSLCFPPALIEDAPHALLERVTDTRPLENGGTTNSTPRGSFVLYLPTVLLRKEHNPAFALAARLANACDLPLLVLATVLDDDHHHQQSLPAKAVAMTSRRLCFTLQALSSAAREWSSHGAAVAIRVQGRGARTPDHLSLCGRGGGSGAAFVVTDEPFVHPYLGYVQRIEAACAASKVPCYRVDGSTTVPPAACLRRRTRGASGYDGVPAKAWMWQKKTEGRRRQCLRAAMAGDLDAPELRVRVDEDRFFLTPDVPDSSAVERVIPLTSLPQSWKDASNPAPGRRPWSVSEIPSPTEIVHWSVAWESADSSVPPCSQTFGTSEAGNERWRYFLTERLSGYARSRNDVRDPHAVSRMSCYLNLGVVSIFRVASDLFAAKRRGNPGAAKFEEELIKWREIGYAHCFANPDTYASSQSVPVWARRYLDGYGAERGGGQGVVAEQRYSLADLERGVTGDANWDAMQRYLVSTGELHNNARMPWGKTVVHWLKRDRSQIPQTANHMPGQSPNTLTDAVLRELVLLNDRYALDGVSPPSYAGILWCFGWGDKAGTGPGGSQAIKEKPASRHRAGPDGFAVAQERLMQNPIRSGGQGPGSAGGRQPSILNMIARTSSSTSLSSIATSASGGCVKEGPSTVVRKKSGRIDSFFNPRPKKRASVTDKKA